jgi:hypothetical protein
MALRVGAWSDQEYRVTRRLRIALATTASLLCLATAATAFWYQDWRYSLPTPRPDGLEQPAVGARLDLAAILGHPLAARPLWIHVVNTACPCSRFNIDHVRSLIRQFGNRFTVVTLVQGDDDPQALVTSFKDLGLATTVIADPGGRLAARLGVYSTPQAVVTTAEGRLYFRGNYNSSRYCADRRTEFARIAMEAMLDGAPPPAMPPEALVAYGCPLPRRHQS